jgi:uncharacterized membrane protein
MMDVHSAAEFTVRGIHAFTVAAWLLFDFIVYWLHFKIKDARADLHERLERVHIMHAIDTVVAYIFIGTLPIGIALAWLTGTPLFSTGWLNWKHLMYGLIIVAAIVLIPVSGTALRNLEAMKKGATNTDELNGQIERDMNRAMPWVFLIWVLIIAMSLVSVLNIKCPHCHQLIFG